MDEAQPKKGAGGKKKKQNFIHYTGRLQAEIMQMLEKQANGKRGVVAKLVREILEIGFKEKFKNNPNEN